VGMTGAHEAVVAQEIGLPYAAVCVVDNVCNGLEAAGEPALSPEAFAAAQASNVALAEAVASAVASALPTFRAGPTAAAPSGHAHAGEWVWVPPTAPWPLPPPSPPFSALSMCPV
jgi:hypothetical protein